MWDDLGVAPRTATPTAGRRRDPDFVRGIIADLIAVWKSNFGTEVI